MQQLPAPRNEQTIGPLQQRFIAGCSSLILAVAQVVLVYWAFPYLHFSFTLLILFIALLYFVIPIPLSAVVAYQARHADNGREASNGIGCIGALLAMFFTGIYLYTLPYNGFYGDENLFLFLFDILLSFICIFIALLGTYIGSIVGARLRKRR